MLLTNGNKNRMPLLKVHFLSIHTHSTFQMREDGARVNRNHPEKSVPFVPLTKGQLYLLSP